MTPELTTEKLEHWLKQLTSHQRKTVKGRIMAELRCGWAYVHEKLLTGFDEQEQKKVLSIFSDYVIVTK